MTASRPHRLIEERWSPYAFDPRPVDREDLRAVLEAAGRAPSSYNEQPWSFVVARREDPADFERILGCLVEANRKWAARAGALAVAVVARRLSRNDKPNRTAEHDLGLAAAFLSLEATARGLHVHQMGGLDLAAAREVLAIPEGRDPWTAIAIGYRATQDAPEDLLAKDRERRGRKPVSAIVHGGRWGADAPWLSG